tara:strand:- start:15 stop:422 length:408 start_codon:yes stop_codon:yes gene_type:complete
MGFFIELSFALLNTNFTDVKNKIIDKSIELRSDFYYQHIEYSNKNTSQIMSFSFPEHDEIFIEFIYFIKKIPHVFIETAGIDDLQFKQLYASKKYLKIMENDKVKEYLHNKKKGILKNYNPSVYNALIKKVKKVL